jgi:hypothetical protein
MPPPDAALEKILNRYLHCTVKCCPRDSLIADLLTWRAARPSVTQEQLEAVIQEVIWEKRSHFTANRLTCLRSRRALADKLLCCWWCRSIRPESSP